YRDMKYRVDWDVAPPQSEVQEIDLEKHCKLRSTFTLEVGDTSSQPLTFDATAKTVASALAEFPLIGMVDVEQRGECRWRVTFSQNVGNLAPLAMRITSDNSRYWAM